MPKKGTLRSRTVGELDLRIIERLQQGLAAVPRPYAEASKELGLSEQTMLERVQYLKRLRVLSYIGPIYFSEAFGQGLSLVAASVPEALSEKVGAIVSRFPEVVHLSTSRNRFNLWFTLRAPGLAAKEQVLTIVGETIGFPTYHLFSLGEFHRAGAAVPVEDAASAVLSELDWRLIAATEKGLPLVAEPYAELGMTLGVSADEILSRFERLSQSGILLRIAGVPNYCRLGLKAAALSLWEVDDTDCADIGPAVTRLPFVSQCSLRPRYLPDWPYNLLVMVHGRTRREVRSNCDAIANLMGSRCRSHDLLFRARTLKKTKAWPLQGIG